MGPCPTMTCAPWGRVANWPIARAPITQGQTPYPADTSRPDRRPKRHQLSGAKVCRQGLQRTHQTDGDNTCSSLSKPISTRINRSDSLRRFVAISASRALEVSERGRVHRQGVPGLLFSDGGIIRVRQHQHAAENGCAGAR